MKQLEGFYSKRGLYTVYYLYMNERKQFLQYVFNNDTDTFEFMTIYDDANGENIKILKEESPYHTIEPQAILQMLGIL